MPIIVAKRAFEKATPIIAAYWGALIAHANRVSTPQEVQQILDRDPNYSAQRVLRASRGEQARRESKRRLEESKLLQQL